MLKKKVSKSCFWVVLPHVRYSQLHYKDYTTMNFEEKDYKKHEIKFRISSRYPNWYWSFSFRERSTVINTEDLLLERSWWWLQFVLSIFWKETKSQAQFVASQFELKWLTNLNLWITQYIQQSNYCVFFSHSSSQPWAISDEWRTFRLAEKYTVYILYI